MTWHDIAIVGLILTVALMRWGMHHILRVLWALKRITNILIDRSNR